MEKNKEKISILKDRVVLYNDFTLNLLYYIDKYYIDKESLYEDEDIYNHFSWCYNKACDGFKREEINFSNNKALKEYFYDYYYHQYYKSKDDDDIEIKKHKDFWEKIFLFETQKSKVYFKILVELYGFFEKTIKEKINSHVLEKNSLEI